MVRKQLIFVELATHSEQVPVCWLHPLSDANNIENSTFLGHPAICEGSRVLGRMQSSWTARPLKLKTLSAFERVVTIYPVTWCYGPGNCSSQPHHHENLKTCAITTVTR